MFINQTVFFVSKIERFKCSIGDFCVVEGSVFRKPFKIKDIKTVNNKLESCFMYKESFKYLKAIGEKIYNDFPNCCESHKKLINADFFEPQAYKDFPDNFAHKVLFTKHQIFDVIDNKDWKKEITNYIDYVVESFGCFPEGYGEPLGLKEYYVQLVHLITIHRHEKRFIDYSPRIKYILTYIDKLEKPSERDIQTDIISLLSIYDQWYQSFPFNISFFSNLKKDFSNTFPFLVDEPVYNPYLGISKAKIQSVEGLLESLDVITSTILSSIDTTQLYKDDYISNESKYMLDLTLNEHAITQKLLLKKFSNGEIKYIKTIKSWLENEKKFVEKITPIVQKINFVSEKPASYISFQSSISNNKQKYILELLEELSLTNNGKSIISNRKKSAIRGVVEALKEKNIVPNIGIDKLCSIIGNKIGLDIKSKLDKSYISEEFKFKAFQYIKDNPIK